MAPKTHMVAGNLTKVEICIAAVSYYSSLLLFKMKHLCILVIELYCNWKN